MAVTTVAVIFSHWLMYCPYSKQPSHSCNNYSCFLDPYYLSIRILMGKWTSFTHVGPCVYYYTEMALQYLCLYLSCCSKHFWI